MRFRPLELFFGLTLALLLLHLADVFFAVMCAVIFGALALGALLISGLAELIERSKVPRSYFGYLLATLLATGSYLVLIYTTGWFRWDML